MEKLTTSMCQLCMLILMSVLSISLLSAEGIDPIKAVSEGVLPSSLPLYAVSVDSTQIDSLVRKGTENISKEKHLVSPKALQVNQPWHPNSNLSMLFSALLPGGGQIYNRKYWKVPIVWGAFTACIYAITWNQDVYSGYKHAYIDLTSDDPMKNTSWQDYMAPGAKPEDEVNSSSLKDRLKRGVDFYRRQRDLSLIVTAGVYLLNILDAYVDAELYQFDISPNLSMRVAPDIVPSRSGGLQYGIGCTLNF